MTLALPAMLLACSDKDEYCNNVSNPVKEIPWLYELVEANKSKSVEVDIYAYEYKGETVFVVNECNGCADVITVAKDCSGNTICEWGGLLGLNTCPDFDEEATNKRLVYKNYP